MRTDVSKGVHNYNSISTNRKHIDHNRLRCAQGRRVKQKTRKDISKKIGLQEQLNGILFNFRLFQLNKFLGIFEK